MSDVTFHLLAYGVVAALAWVLGYIMGRAPR